MQIIIRILFVNLSGNRMVPVQNLTQLSYSCQKRVTYISQKKKNILETR